MFAVASDDACGAAQSLAESITAEGLAQVQFVTVDNPSRHYLLSLKNICPNLQVMALDPVHLAMTCEYASSRKRTKATKTLRCILSKFSAVDHTYDAASWGHVFHGRSCKGLTVEESSLRQKIEDRTMRVTTAEQILSQLDPSRPFYTRVEWIRSLAALASVFRDEVSRLAPGPNRRIYQLLHTAAAAERSEWYMNNIRLRHSMPRHRLSLLPVGTTSNESLHHEINCWFRETQQMHQSTLQLKLRVLKLGKLMSHNSALYQHTSKQLPHSVVLARASRRALWSEEAWQTWCKELRDDGAVSKASLPLSVKRQQEKLAVKAAVVRMKRPAATHSSVAKKRRHTPHTLHRKDSLRRGGVRSST